MRGYGTDTQVSPYTPGQEPWIGDSALEEVYHRYRHVILGPHRKQTVRHIFNFPVLPDVSSSELRELARDVEERMDTTFRFNAALGVILRNRHTGEYRYFHPDENVTLLPAPLAVYDAESLAQAVETLGRIDLESAAMQDRPDTAWELYMICHVTYYVYETGYVLGNYSSDEWLSDEDDGDGDENDDDEGEEDDTFLDGAAKVARKKRCIQSTNRQSTNRSGDNLCFFRYVLSNACYHVFTFSNRREKCSLRFSYFDVQQLFRSLSYSCTTLVIIVIF